MTPRQSLEHLRNLVQRRRNRINEQWQRYQSIEAHAARAELDDVLVWIDTELAMPAFHPAQRWNRTEEQEELFR